MHGLLLVFCLMAVSMPTTAFLPVLPPKPPDKVSPAPTTCAAVSCVRGQECRFVTEGLHVAPRCLDSEEIPRGGSDACGKTGHPLLIAKETEEGTEYSVFRCKDLCPALHLLFVDGVCCAGVDTCDLPRDPGPCEAIFPRYYYDSVKQKCLKFNYGGCDGNQNNFKTLPECQKACQKAACDLPRDPGPCKALFPRYYYDSDKNKCLKFNYGGCAGNANNFKTLPECQKVCVKDKCKLPRDPGPCKALFPRYYYDSNEQKCLKFNYGGCAGNPNNFKTLPECQKACQGEGGICQLPKETGPCRAHFPRYYYDSAQKKCLRFVYGGCRGNKNNFKTLDECKKTCHKTPPPPVGSCPPVIPTRPGVCAFTCKADSDCKPGDKCCRTACGGRTCVRPVVKPPGCAAITCLKGTECVEDKNGARCKPKGICQLPKETGPCRAFFRRYYYDSGQKKCLRFVYGGCRGNKNNFKTLDECQKACHKTPPPPVGSCPPVIPTGPGICAFTCNADSDCKPGDKCCRTGCGGRTCVRPVVKPPGCAAITCLKGTECVEDKNGARCKPKDICQLPKVPGPCRASFRRYYYDSGQKKCLDFVYGGCRGNKNNFKTLDACKTACHKNICKLPRDPGPCKALFPRYYYDSNKQKCLKFNYGSCAGSENNFKTLPECQKACQGEGGICQLPKETGPCRAFFRRYYYDSGQKKCLRFVYGGCRGNKNNFKTLDECKKACHKTPPPPVGSCPPVIPTRPGVCAFTCNADSDCKPGDKCCRTACGGRTCVRPVVKPPGCAAITCLKGTECIEDEAGARCKPIVTVGKCPPPGRFGICAFTCSGDSSCGKGKKCCKTACGGTMCKTAIPLPTCAATTCKKGTKCVEDDTTGARCEPIDICQLPRVTGPCRARLRRYYYDPKKQQCNRFYYGGCRGNKNNFRSKLACEKACQKPSVGICPPALPSPPGTCGKPCKEDRHCKKGEKCCKTGCGHKGCRPTVKPPTCASTLCIVGTVCKETRKGAKCVKVKPGICPGIQKKKTCGRKCKHDEDCPKKQKCCNVGCKRNTCVNPLPPCAVVRCGHGLVCINTPTGGKCVPAGPRPGQCPKFKCAPFPPTCVHKCKQDSECPTGRKCCSSCTGCKDCLTSYALDPCAKKKCKKGEKCKLQVVQCIRAPCPPLPVCVPAEKPGACPNVTGPGICVSLCQNDQSCPGDQKCCSNGCGQVCMGPVPTCANKKCKIGQKCKLIDVLCIRAPCPSPIPTCVPAEPGKCPPPKCPLGLKPAPCRSQCQKDHDCPKFHKCCKGCGNCRECVKSILPPLCNSVKCGPGKECVLEEVVCITLPCNPLPVCVYKGRKAGQCPTPGPESKQNCKSSCQSDSQCKGADKCCPTTCGAAHCSPTVPTSTCKDVKCPDKQKCRVLYDKRIQTAQCFARPPPLPHPDATCPNGFPLLLYPQPAAPIVAFCGRGPNRIQCPPTHDCKISPVDLFAVCCRRPTQGAQGPYCNPDCGVGERCDRHLILCRGFGPCPPTPRCEDVCLLGRTPGVCKPVGQRYYYDSKARQCVAYVNGCPGTGNNFGSEQECKTQCYRHVCQLPKDPGPCKASIVRYYYDTKLGKCQSFIYGCQGNANNFQSLKDCSRACAKVKPGQCPRTGGRGLCVASGYCQQDRDCPGNKKCCETECNGAVCVDPQPTCADTECKPGTDCIENGGNPKCVSPKPGGCPHPPCAPPPPYPPKCLDKCKTDHDCPGNQKCCNACSRCKSCHTPFPPPPPTCSNKICKKGEKCVLKKVVCKRLPCHPQPVCVPASKHKCLLPKDPGPCKAAFTKYYYDSAKGKCSEFTYGGCKGNGNRFDSLDDCKKACSQHICKLPSITGMCRAYIPSYFYNTKTGKCERFIYGGCQGNDNRFSTEKECQDVCTPEE